YRDAWFIGYTGGFVTAVWVGKDDNTPMKKVTGGAAPAGIWHDYMTAALPRLKVEPIPASQPPAPAPSNLISDVINGAQQLIRPPDQPAPQQPPQNDPNTPPY
ncbi:MAG: hypothetical protein JWP50_3415, partial [Phenylobacterium sp.]|nr:hypothetical protein [Phenylobacterium sp.]